MNKRAEIRFQQEYLVFLLILLVAVVVLILFLDKMKEVSEAENIPDLCRKNIEISSIGRVAGMELYDEIKCPTEYKEIGSTDEEEIKKELADGMASCWYKMGEGKYEVFETALLSDTHYCVICSVTEFSNDDKHISNFLDYLEEKEAPVYYTKTPGMNYMTYLQSGDAENIVKTLRKQETADTLETKQPYATIFLYTKQGDIPSVWGAIGGAGTGFVGGTLAGVYLIGITNPLGLTVTAGIAISATLLGASTGGAATFAGPEWNSGVLLYPYTSEALSQLNCEVLPVAQQSGEVSLQV